MQPRDLQLFKKENPTQAFSCEFRGISKSSFFTENIRALLLKKPLTCPWNISKNITKIFRKSSCWFLLDFKQSFKRDTCNFNKKRYSNACEVMRLCVNFQDNFRVKYWDPAKSSRPNVFWFYEIAVLMNFTIFTGKTTRL